MRRLPLYTDDPRLAPVATTPGLALDSSCRRCVLHDGARTVCLPAEGEPGGLLVVLDSPSREEDAAGRPAIGRAGALVRKLVAKHWGSGPVAIDTGVRCAPGGAKPGPDEIEACRPYLAQTFAEVAPKRVLVFGSTAAFAVLGRSPPPLSVRRGYGWASPGVPVFFMPHPVVALRNRIHGARFAEDVEWALTVNPATLLAPSATEEFYEVEHGADGMFAELQLREHRQAGGWVAFDTETAGVMFDPSFRLLAVSMCASGSDAVYTWGPAALADRGARLALEALLTDPKLPKVGQNLKYDVHAVSLGLGIQPEACVGDTRLWRKLRESNALAGLEYQAELVGMGGHKDEAYAHVEAACATIRKARLAYRKKGIEPPLDLRAAVIDFPDSRPEQWAYTMVPRDVLLRYNARDAQSTAKLARSLAPQVMADRGLANVWTGVLQGATDGIQQVEAWGIAVDREGLERFGAHLQAEKAAALATFAQYPDFNPDSTHSVRKLLYETLNLPAVRETPKGAPSTDEATLSILSMRHPGSKVLRSLMSYRKVAKMLGTYYEGMRGFVRADGRIHPSLKIDGAATGRLSCSEPNLQNIPRVSEGDWGGYPRAVFVAPPGYELLQADYSQLELRVAAMLSGDEAMKAIFREGVDYHQRTAELIAPIAWRIKPEQVTKEHRAQAKTVNFGVLYGMTAPALAARMGCSRAQAEAVVEAIFGKFKRLHAWTRECLAHARKHGEARTLWAGGLARRRDLSDIGEADEAKRSTAENSSWNTPVQGTASDFCLASVVEVVRWLRDDVVPAKLVLTVHDSLLLEVRSDAFEEVAGQVRRIMRSWYSWDVPLEVDLERGPTWGALQKWEEPVRASLRALGADPNQADLA